MGVQIGTILARGMQGYPSEPYETHMRPPVVNRHDLAIPESSVPSRYWHPDLQVICLLIQCQVLP